VYVTQRRHSSPEQRLLQVEAVRDIVLSAYRVGPPSGNLAVSPSYIVMGDFNFPPTSQEYTLLTGEWRGGRQLVRSDGFVDAWRLVEDTPGRTVGLDGSRGRRNGDIFVPPDLSERVDS